MKAFTFVPINPRFCDDLRNLTTLFNKVSIEANSEVIVFKQTFDLTGPSKGIHYIHPLHLVRNFIQ
jgi:hypothetical protein